MTQKAALADIQIGIEPPINPTPNTRWISQSARHLTLPNAPFARARMMGGQEFSPWYNPILDRYEALVQSGSQLFTYAEDPLGPWATAVSVLGAGNGGEASNAQQTYVMIEGTTIYAFYLQSGSATTMRLAKAQMPTTVGTLPVFSQVGVVWTTSGPVVGDSCCVIPYEGGYLGIMYENAVPMWARSAATTPEGLVALPFERITTTLTAYTAVSLGFRPGTRIARPQIFRENGVWILFGHMLSGIEFGQCNIYRYTSTDLGIPTNWTVDPVRFLEQRHPLEVDQTVDFRLFYSKTGQAFAYWSGNNNRANGTSFNIMGVPCNEPIMAYDGSRWNPTNHLPNDSRGQAFIDPDIATNSVSVSNLWDIPFRTDAANMTATLPAAANRTKVRVTNSPTATTTRFVVHFAVQGVDKIMGPIPIATLTRVGTLVTVVTNRAHLLQTNDYVTMTGCTPTGYNRAAAQVTVVDATTFQYTVGVDPGACTVIGGYDTSLLAGESREYRCIIDGTFTRIM